MDKPAVNILGISAFYHDSAACFVRDGEIIAAVQEERFSRVKHDERFPTAAVKYCMDQGRIGSDNLDLIVFHEKPFIRFERLLETYLDYAPRGFDQFVRSISDWLRKKLWIKDIIRRETGFDGQILFPTHHETHAAAAFYPSPFPEAAILTMDGVGEWATAAYGIGTGKRITLERELRFPHSLGLLYSAFTSFTGFEVNEGEYKVMGLAPYGEPVYRDLILNELMDLREDGSLRLNMEYFNYCTGLTMTSPRFGDLFNATPRQPGSPLRQVDMDLARSVQEVTEDVVLKMAQHLKEQTGENRLVMSGGVALNSVANGKLQRAGIFDDVWIQPAAGDAGSALGAALFGWHQYLGNERIADGVFDGMKGALLGPRFNDEQIGQILDLFGASYEKLKEPELLESVSKFIEDGKVVGWFQGKMEFGPRALGSRSILADARRPEMQERINKKIKFREGFRPFAPAVLTDRAGEYFDMSGVSPYMLKVFPVRDEHLVKPGRADLDRLGLDKLKFVRSDIPAVTHVDTSARVQTVEQDANPRFVGLLHVFYEKTGVPLVVNTSFNVRGEPIVCTPQDALNCFLKTDMDILAMGSFILEKKEQIKPPGGLNLAVPDDPEVVLERVKQLRTFGLSTGFGLMVLSLILRLKFSPDWWWIITCLGGVGMMSGLLYPKYLAGPHRIWSNVTGAIGKVIVTTAMFTGFFCILLPTALMARIMGRHFIERGPDDQQDSYWEKCAYQDDRHCEKQH